jgi:hypothetical protein
LLQIAIKSLFFRWVRILIGVIISISRGGLL